MKPIIFAGNNAKELIKHAIKTKKASRRTGKLPRGPKIQYPRPAERQYQRALLKIVGVLKTLTKKDVLLNLSTISLRANLNHPNRQDAWTDDVETVINKVRIQFAREYSEADIKTLAQLSGKSVDFWNKRQMNSVLNRVLGIDLIKFEPWLDDVMKGFVKENVDLISSIPDKFLGDVEGIITRGFRSGTRVEDLSQEIEDRFDVTDSRADLIARDQIGKLNGQLSEARQTDLGLNKYIWRTSQDERVRGNPAGLYPNADPSHWEREGEIFDWSDPPEDGHPGEPIQCRCYAEPVLDADEESDT